MENRVNLLCSVLIRSNTLTPQTNSKTLNFCFAWAVDHLRWQQDNMYLPITVFFPNLQWLNSRNTDTVSCVSTAVWNMSIQYSIIRNFNGLTVCSNKTCSGITTLFILAARLRTVLASWPRLWIINHRVDSGNNLEYVKDWWHHYK